MNSPKRFWLLAILLVAVVSVSGIQALAKEANNERNPFFRSSDTTRETRDASESGFDYYLVDTNGDDYAQVLHDYDGAWSNFPMVNGPVISGIWGVDGRDLYCGYTNWSNSGVIHYHEGEEIIEHFTASTGGSFAGGINDVWGFSTENIFAVGTLAWGNDTYLFQYSDGAWNQVAYESDVYSSQAVWGSSETDIFTVGLYGEILHYDGLGFTPMLPPTEMPSLNDVWGTASNNVYIVGDNGTLLHYGGSEWLQVSIPASENLNAIWGLGPDDIYVVGNMSTILHWDGSTWEVVTPPSEGNTLTGVYGSSPNDILVVGYSGVIWNFNGTEWTTDTSYPGGLFQSVWGGLRADGDQYWDSTMGTPSVPEDWFNDTLFSIIEYDGAKTIGGEFQNSGPDNLNGIAYWNGFTWLPLYDSIGPNGVIHDLEMFGSTLICAGGFTAIDGVPINCVAAWNGETWSQLGAGLGTPGSSGELGEGVWDLIVYNNDLYALGEPNCTAKWDGSTWTALSWGAEPTGDLLRGVIHNESLYAGGYEIVDGNLRKLEGDTWVSMNPDLNGFVVSLYSENQNLYLGGMMALPGLEEIAFFAVWDGVDFQRPEALFDGPVYCIKEYNEGLFIGGYFRSINGVRYGGCAFWDRDVDWRPLGSGINSMVWTALIDGDDITVIGDFGAAGNHAANNISQWIPQELSIPDPPVTFPPEANQDYTISINIGGDPGAHPVYLHYRLRDNPSSYETTLMMRSDNKDGLFSGTVPGSFFGDLGFQYYVSTGSGTDPVFYPESAPEEPAFIGVSLTDEALGVLISNQYVMIGIPFVPDKNISDILTDALGAYDPTKWRFGRWNPTTVGYDEYPTVSAVMPGRGYWLIQKNPVVIPATGVTTSTVGDVVISLEPGWNMIATPYNFEIAWSSVTLGSNVENQLITWSGGGYVTATIMNPWQGYWVRNLGLTGTTITIPSTPVVKSAERKTSPVKTVATDWEISIAAEKGDRFDRNNVAGISSSAEPGPDPQDYFEPPAMPDGVSLYFEVEEGDKSHALSRDIRGTMAEGECWEMVLKQPGGGMVNLTIDGCLDVPGEHNVVLITGNQTYDLRETSDIRISVGSSGETRMRLAVGDQTYIEASEQSMPRPFALRPVYPNPFNPKTTVSFTLPKSSQVRIDIFDIRGRLVTHLVDENFEAGLHEVSWQGLDNEGKSASAGVYFCQLRADDFVQNRKMTLVK